MISNLENEFEINLKNYKTNNTEENKKHLIESIIKLDKELTRNYLEELKAYTTKEKDIVKEQTRLKNILAVMKKRSENREYYLKLIEELSLGLTLENIPNIDKIVNFTNKLKVVETIINIISKINEKNKEKAIEILNRKEFKIVLLEFYLISNDTNEEVEKYVNSLLKTPTSNDTNSGNSTGKIKILDYYYNNKNDFPDLSIPNMGLIKDEKTINIDNRSFFIN